MNKTLSIFIGIALLIVAAAIAVHLAVIRPVAAVAEKAVEVPDKIAGRMFDFGKYGIDAFKAIFQSQVNVVSTTTVCDATSIAELAVLKRNIREIIDYKKTDYASTKHIIAEQTFVAKIGFDLASKFSASYDSSKQTVTIILPEPKILSLEALNPAPVYYLDESGYINKISTGDHQQILIQLKDKALNSVDSTLAIGDAKQMIETRFLDLFRAFNVKVVVRFSSDKPIIKG
ncbi:MAG: DUF4230 domain-containing protein [Verrucomicrobiota bacterium]|jgi:hypothetical protein